ncbi:MAG: hypothetical protein GWN31_12925, partial [Candidatus Thorarchaeota archaeon]|nr:hypothetical protein [Candidatus Thorarchaeota archaeon]
RQQILFDWGLEGGIAHFDIKEDETSQQEETSPKEEKKQQTKESKASSPKKKEDKEEKAEKEDKAKKKDKVEDKPGKAYDEFYHSGNDKKPRKDNILVAWWNSKTEDHSLGGKNERGTYIPVKGMKHNSKDWNVALGMARACAEMLSVQKPPKKGFDRVAVIK